MLHARCGKGGSLPAKRGGRVGAARPSRMVCHAKADQQPYALSWRLLWRALEAAPQLVPLQESVASSTDSSSSSMDVHVPAAPLAAEASIAAAPADQVQAAPPPRHAIFLPPVLADQHQGPAHTAAGMSLLDRTLARLAGGGESSCSVVEDMVAGLEQLRGGMTADEWAAFCGQAQHHPMQRLLEAPAAPSTNGSSNSNGGSLSHSLGHTMGHEQPALHVVVPAPLHHNGASSTASVEHAARSSGGQHGTAGGAAGRAPEWRHAGAHIAAAASLPQYEALVFSGGGARCLSYIGAVHKLRELGMLRSLRMVAGSSGGAVFAVATALGFTPQEVLVLLDKLPEREGVSWFGLNSRLGLADGEATFTAITRAIGQRIGAEDPTLEDVAVASGLTISLTATSLASRRPIYLSSATHGGMRLFDALRSSCAVPLYFSPVRWGEDLLVDGCLTDCSPVGALWGTAAGSLEDDLGPISPDRVLVLNVTDMTELDAGDLQGLLHGLVGTILQAGWHRTGAADTLELWPAVSGVNPLQFKVPYEQAREVVARSQSIAEEFAAGRAAQAAAKAEAKAAQAAERRARAAKQRAVKRDAHRRTVVSTWDEASLLT